MSEAALKLSVYVGERDHVEHGLAADALLALFERHGVRASVMLRGIEGFGVAHSMHTDTLLTLSEDLPIVAIALDEGTRVEGLLRDVRALCRKGLITLERARLVQLSDGADAPWGDRVAAHEGEAVKLSVFMGRGERTDGERAYVAAVQALQRGGAWGASVLLGLDGTLDGRRRRARVFAHNAGVPLMVTGIAPAASATGAAGELERVVGARGVMLERVQVCKRDGVLIGPPPAAPERDAEGRPYWQKLSIYSSERARHGSQPLHAALVRALRARGAAGATSLRAQWGFHGDHPPHGERLLSLERHVPVVTVTIDTPGRVRELFETVDALTGRTGLVTSETVPALRATAGGPERGALGLARRWH